MAKAKEAQEDTGYVTLTAAEKELFEFAREGEQFRKLAWRMYGGDWPDHLPRAEDTGLLYINALAEYLFGFQFQDFQAELYYCPILDRIIVGARGCGKTLTLAMAYVLYALLHPGHNWLHVAPTLDQARMPFDLILEWGARGAFNDLFLKHSRAAPAPDIFLKPWDEHDPGTTLRFRSIGGHGGAPMELLRSARAALLSADEAFRVFNTDYYVSVLAGMALGPNMYVLNANKDLRDEYNRQIREVQVTPDPLQKKFLREKLDAWINFSGVGLNQMLTLVGNAGHHPIWWNRLRWGVNHPESRWSKVWISDQNLYFGTKQRKLLEQQFINDPHGLRTELYADRPPATGDIFNDEDVDSLSDESFNKIAADAISSGKEGWIYEISEQHGLVSYAEPLERNITYAAGTDPGTGQLPHRNSWVILACRLDGPPFKIVYLRCGNFQWRERGKLGPWIAAMHDLRNRYMFPHSHIAVEASGPQKGVHEVLWGVGISDVVPITMSNKGYLAMCAQRMLGRGMFIGPFITLLDTQLREYVLNDRKLDQDFVMAFLSMVSVVWPYVAHYFEEPEQSEEDTFWNPIEAPPRDVRDTNRDVRWR